MLQLWGNLVTLNDPRIKASCISDFSQPCISKMAGLRAKPTPKSVCYPTLCGHCLPSWQDDRPGPWA